VRSDAQGAKVRKDSQGKVRKDAQGKVCKGAQGKVCKDASAQRLHALVCRPEGKYKLTMRFEYEQK
jgi:hypothetical protein